MKGDGVQLLSMISQHIVPCGSLAKIDSEVLNNDHCLTMTAYLDFQRMFTPLRDNARIKKMFRLRLECLNENVFRNEKEMCDQNMRWRYTYS